MNAAGVSELLGACPWATGIVAPVHEDGVFEMDRSEG